MLNIEIDKENGIVIFTPDNKLSQADFEHATRVIDPFIDEYGRINGLIILSFSPVGSLLVGSFRIYHL